MIKICDVSYSYSNKNVLDGITLNIQNGDVISLLGANGAGKTTLIKLILGLLSPSTGKIYLEDKDVSKYKQKDLAKKIAYVPQNSFLPFSFSVLEVVMMGRIAYQSIFSSYNKIDKEIALNSLEIVGLSNLYKKAYNELSGGQKRLVLIARALAQEAKIFIMDEPVSGLDYGNQLRLLEHIKKLSQKGYTFIKSTHYPDHAFLVSNKSILIKDGKVLDDGVTSEVINENSIKQLYGIDVEITDLYKHSFCVPKFA